MSASLSAIALFLLATATANTALFAQGYDTLLILNGVLVALLMLVVGWQLWQLRRNLTGLPARDPGRWITGWERLEGSLLNRI